MRFDSNRVYDEKINLAFGVLDLERVALVLRDGRCASHLIHAHLLHRFENLQATSDKLGLLDDDGQRFLVRVITDGGVSLTPSKNVGTGRDFHIDDYAQALREITGFILVDIRLMPFVSYTAVLKESLPKKASLSCKEAVSILNDLERAA